MSREELNTQLYDKMALEQAKYQDWLLAQSAIDILSHASEYSFREDILMSLEGRDLTEALEELHRQYLSDGEAGLEQDIRYILEATTLLMAECHPAAA